MTERELSQKIFQETFGKISTNLVDGLSRWVRSGGTVRTLFHDEGKYYGRQWHCYRPGDQKIYSLLEAAVYPIEGRPLLARDDEEAAAARLGGSTVGLWREMIADISPWMQQG